MTENNLITLINKSNKSENTFSSVTDENKLGSSIEFKPVIENEFVSKGGLKFNLFLKYHSITCMKEYENKSFEELKYEDYQINRNHSQSFLNTTFSLATTNPFFNNTILITAFDSAPRENYAFYQNQDFDPIKSTEITVPKNLLSSSLEQLEDLKKHFFHGKNNSNIGLIPAIKSNNPSLFYEYLNNKYNKNKADDEKVLHWNKQVRNLHKFCSKLKRNPNQKRTNTDTHPTGIILTRPDYYTIPSLNELIHFINIDGSCTVQGFTVGRHGYGYVYFPDTFDVSNLNLDEIVHFNHKGINIYPDESKKPPAGQGLNRKVQITLHNMYPRNKN